MKSLRPRRAAATDTKLQVALDGDLESSVRVLALVAPWVDVVEIGTPLILREGMRAVRRVREAFPQLALLADFKIMDAGELEASIAFEAGCDWVTVLGAAHPATLRGALNAAVRYERRVMVDLIQVPHVVETTTMCLELGCHALLVHTAHDVAEERTSLADFALVRHTFPQAPLAIAGGITLERLDTICAFAPSIVVVGSAITGASNPDRVAAAFRQRLRNAQII